MADVLIALGGNLGDRRERLRDAVRRLDSLPSTRVVRVSSLYETRAVGLPAGSPDFLNAVAQVRTELPPEALMEACIRLEAEAGRSRPAPRASGGMRAGDDPLAGKDAPAGDGALASYASRTLDLDLLRYDDRIMSSPSLTLPHPRIVERPFVLEPLRELAPGWTIRGRTIAAWAADHAAAAAGVVRLPGGSAWADIHPD